MSGSSLWKQRTEKTAAFHSFDIASPYWGVWLMSRLASTLSLVNRPTTENPRNRRVSSYKVHNGFFIICLSLWWNHPAMSLQVKVNEVIFQRHPVGREQWKEKKKSCRKWAIQRRSVLSSWMSIQLILRSYFGLIHTGFLSLAKAHSKSCVGIKGRKRMWGYLDKE